MSHYNLDLKSPYFQLANIFEPLSTQHFDQSYQSIEALINEEPWDEHLDGRIPSKAVIECRPTSWHTAHWWQCTISNTVVNWNGYEFRELFDYDFFGDYSIYTGHHLDLY